MTAKKFFLTGYFVFAAVAAVCGWFSISGMYRGSAVFMQKIGAGSYDVLSLRIMTASITALTAAFIIALFFLLRALVYKKNGNRKITAELAFLAALLLVAVILFWHFIPPTKLMIALAEDSPARYIEKIAKKSCNINGRRAGHTAFTFAVFNGASPEIIKILAENGADVNEIMPGGYEPACIVFLTKIFEKKTENENDSLMSLEAVRALTENGMKIDSETYAVNTPLTSVIGENADAAVVEMIIKAGADVNRQLRHPATGEKGVTALMLASFGNVDRAIAELLLQNGADVNIKTGQGATALIAAANHDGNAGLVKSFIERGADVNAKTSKGTTALIAAARNNGSARIIEILLEAKADAGAKDNEGRTALDYLQSNNKMPAADKEKAAKLLAKL